MENYDQMYDYYEEIEPNMRLSRFAHWVMDKAYDPVYIFVGDTEDVTAEHLAAGGGLLIPMNHSSIHDQFVAADMANRNEGLHPLRGNYVIPAKIGLFETTVLRVIPLRPFLDRLGAVPTHRGLDIRKTMPEQAELQKLAGQKLVDVCIEKFDNGASVAIFPENTRNKGDARIIQPLKLGVGKIACGVSPDRSLLIMTASIYYGGYGHDKRRPYVVLDYLPVTSDDPVEVTHAVAKNMQHGLGLAVQASGNPYWHTDG